MPSPLRHSPKAIRRAIWTAVPTWAAGSAPLSTATSGRTRVRTRPRRRPATLFRPGDSDSLVLPVSLYVSSFRTAQATADERGAYAVPEELGVNQIPAHQILSRQEDPAEPTHTTVGPWKSCRRNAGLPKNCQCLPFMINYQQRYGPYGLDGHPQRFIVSIGSSRQFHWRSVNGCAMLQRTPVEGGGHDAS